MFSTIFIPALLAQFGNINVEWPSASASASSSATRHPRVATERASKLATSWAPGDRRHALSQLSVDALGKIVTGLGATCDSCEGIGHWVAKVRGAVLDLPPKQLRVQLSKRGVKCEGCTTREQLLDRLLDSVHLPLQS